MSIEVRRANVSELESWDDYVSQSSQAGPFHQRAGFRLLEHHTDATAHPLVGYKGEQPIGVLPVYERQRGPISMVVSPPKHTEVYYLGPALLNTDRLKQRKIESRNRAFVDGCLEWIDETLSPDITHIRTVDRYADHRPFKENGYEITPYYTYVVDLAREPDELLMEFSSDARSNVRNTDDGAYEIELGGLDAAREIIERVRERHDEQGKAYYITPEYVEELYAEFPDGQVRPYVCRTDDGIAGGILAIEHGDTIYRWQGGTKADVEIPVNDILDWHVMRDAMDRGVERYDLVGANTRRLCRYKSKFAPELVTYHGARRRSRRARVLSSIRSTLPIEI